MWRIWAAALFWGLNWPAIKIVLGGVGPWTLRAVGLGAAAVLLVLLARAFGKPMHILPKHRRHVVIAGLLNVAGFNIFAVFAQLSMPTSRAAILTFTMPFWAALFGWMALGERVDKLRAASLILGASGLTVLALPFWPVIAAGGVPLGLVYVLGAAISWAAGTVYLKAYPIAADPLAVTAWQVAVAAGVCTLGLSLFETPRLDLGDPRVAIALAYHILLPQTVAYVLWFGLVSRVSSSTASLGTLLIPIFGVTGAVLLLDERPTALDLAGFTLILLAVALDQALRALFVGRSSKART